MVPIYEKYASWMDEGQARRLREALEDSGRRVHEARKAVCTPLSPQVEAGIVPPDAWRKTELCKRPLSWYWHSRHAGSYLAVSSFPLDEYGLSPQIVLRASDFQPEDLPDEGAMKAMVQRESYLRAKPPEWDRLEPEEIARLERWMRVMGVRKVGHGELLLRHCANHANFIEPQYFIRQGEEKVPFSIAGTRFVCSACLEFFNVVGEGFRRKRVVPCPGAVMFAGLSVNRYIEVETLEQKANAE